MSVKIYRKLSTEADSAYQLIATLTASETEYSASGLASSTTYDFKAVREVDGVDSAPVYISATTEAANVAPTITLAIDDPAITTAESALLTATPADSDGTIAKVGFYQGATLLGEVTSPPYIWPVNGLSVGSYSYTAKAYDNEGLTTDSDPVTLEVSAVNIAPVANAGADSSLSLPITTIPLNGSASYDPDGTITAYSWAVISQPGGASVTITDPTAASTEATGATVAGLYTFELTVTDNSGATHTDSVTKTVNAASASTVWKVVFDGDSLSTNSGYSADPSYPDYVQTSLGTTDYSYANYAVPGQTSADALSDAATQIDNAYDATKAGNILVFEIGRNDLSTLTNPTSNMSTYLAGRVAKGYKVIMCTVTPGRNPAQVATHWDQELLRQTTNTWLRENYASLGVSVLVDVATSYKIGLYDSPGNTTYFVDGVHMKGPGRQIWADMVEDAILLAKAGGTGVIVADNAIDQTVTGLSKLTEDDTLITRTGTWAKYTTSVNNPDGGAHRATNEVGAKFSVLLNTDRVKLLSVKKIQSTDFTVKIDGVAVPGGSNFAHTDTDAAVIWDSGVLSATNHTIEVSIVPNASKYVYLDAVYYTPSVAPDPDVTGYEIVDDGSAEFTRTGTWTNVNDTGKGFVNNQCRTTSSNPGAVSITKTCSRFKIRSYKGPSMCNAQVWLDGSQIGVIAQYDAASGTSFISFDSGPLTPGSHVIELRRVHDGVQKINHDAFYFLP